MSENPIEAAVEYAKSMGEQAAIDMREYLQAMPYGVTKATPEQDMAFVQLMLKKWPPAWWVYPDGREEFNSPWVIALREKFVEEPKGAWRGVKAALERLGPQPVPMMPDLAGAPPSMPSAMGVVPPAIGLPPPESGPPPITSPMSPRFLQRPNIPMGGI